jgi:septum site-determining protein MinC
LRDVDPRVLLAELALRIAAAPNSFQRAPLILDLSRLPDLPDAEQTRALLDAARSAGHAAGSACRTGLRKMHNWRKCSICRFLQNSASRPSRPAARPRPAASARRFRPQRARAYITQAGSFGASRSMRAGRDLTVAAAVGNGAEVIADGSIHIYGRPERARTRRCARRHGGTHLLPGLPGRTRVDRRTLPRARRRAGKFARPDRTGLARWERLLMEKL